MRVTLNDGTADLVLVHIEIQNQVDLVFPERMFIYGYRLYDRHKTRVVSLAILGDDDPIWRPQGFGYELWGYEIKLRFPIIKLLDYEADWAALEQSKNPFAVVGMPHLRAKATQRYPQTRLRWKIDLVKALYAKQFTRQEIAELFRFIDWVTVLPDRYETRFENALKEIEESEKMRYVTTIERRAIERGSVETAREALIEALTLRFHQVPEDIVETLRNLSNLKGLKSLFRQAILAGSLEEFEHALETGVRR